MMNNPLMNNNCNTSSTGNTQKQLINIMQMLKSGNPEAIFNQMLQQNPDFKKFMESNKGTTPAQFAQAHGLDLQSLLNKI